MMTTAMENTLQRAAGILEGLSASEGLNPAMADKLITVIEMIDSVLRYKESMVMKDPGIGRGK
jgi:hypothetical protein